MMFEYEGIGQVLLRLIILFGFALAVVRIMGNRTVGQLSPFDFVLMVGVGDIIVTASMDRAGSIWVGVEGLAALLILQQLLSRLALKSVTLRKWFEGTPVTLIQDGKVLHDNFVKTQFNYDDLRQELHKQGMDLSNIKDIRLARLESCGQFTLIKNPETDPLTKKDFENYFKTIYNNPLSMEGSKWVKLEQFINDVHLVAEQIKKQDSGAPTTEHDENDAMQQTKQVH